jgi:hemolysin activation/secretion protein
MNRTGVPMERERRRASTASIAALLALSFNVDGATAGAGSSEESTQPDIQRFDVLEFRILGNTTLPQDAVERAVYAHLGPGRTIADVEAARASLESTYREAGFGTVFVDIPEQDTAGGVVRLRVTEGRLARVRVTGGRYFSHGRILEAIPALEQGAVPYLPAVQAQAAAVNRGSADRSVTPVLRAGREPGTVDVELKVKDTLPFHGSLELNDRYTADTTRLRATVSLGYDNLFDRQHAASLLFQTAPEATSELRAIVGTYSFRPARFPDVPITLYAVDSDTDVATLGTLSVLGNGQIFGARATRPLPGRENYFHSVSFGVEYKDFLENVLLDVDEGLQTPVSYLNWPVGYNGLWRAADSTTSFNVGVNFGIRGAGNDAREFAEKRYRGVPNYMYLRGGLQHLHTLPHDLQLFARFAAQASSVALVSNEQFSVGGAESVRGYLESNDFGDSGLSGTLELRSLRPAAWAGLPPGSAYVLAFYDAGVVSIVDALPDQASRVDLASWGVGLRAEWMGLGLALDWAHALTASGTVRAGDERTHFSVRYGF